MSNLTKLQCDFCKSEINILHLSIASFTHLDICWHCLMRVCDAIEVNLMDYNNQYSYLILTPDFISKLEKINTAVFSNMYNFSQEALKRIVAPMEDN